MRFAWLVVAACSSPAAKPEPPELVVVAADASIDAAAPVVVRPYQIAAGAQYACALRDGVVCWGRTPLGERDKPTRIAKTPVVGIAAASNAVYGWTADGVGWAWSPENARQVLTGVSEIVATDNYVCARHVDERVTCWNGGNRAEIEVRAKEIAVAIENACARTESGAVMCWNVRDPKPVAIADAQGAIALAGGGLRLAAVMPDGNIVEWSAFSGQRLPAPKLPGIAKLAFGQHETCALGQRLVCWKEETPGSRREVPLVATDVVVGATISCAQTTDGVACWGEDFRSSTEKPIEVAGLTDVVQLSAGGRHTCARRANGTVACWGERITDAWSTTFKIYDLRPVEVGITDAIELAVAVRNACARRKGGTVECWGHDDVSDVKSRPTPVQQYEQSRALVAHRSSVCALRDGQLDCRANLDEMFEPFAKAASRIWSGDYLGMPFLCAKVASHVECQQGFFGRHGDLGGAEPSTLDTELGDVIDVLLPDAEDNLCLLRASGLVECRGVYEHTAWTPILEDGVTLAYGSNRDVCALRKTGMVSCWAKDHLVTDVPGLRDAVELVGAGLHACARRKSGRVVCWGDMDLVGHGKRADTNTPAFVL